MNMTLEELKELLSLPISQNISENTMGNSTKHDEAPALLRDEYLFTLPFLKTNIWNKTDNLVTITAWTNSESWI